MHVVKTVYRRIGDRAFSAAEFYAVVRGVYRDAMSRECQTIRQRASYDGLIERAGEDSAGARLYRLTPHGIARIENAA
jgi:hypothetical protein